MPHVHIRWCTFGAALCSTLIERRPFAQCSTDTAKPQHGVSFMVDRRGKDSSTCCVYFGWDRTEPKTGCAKCDRRRSCLPFPVSSVSTASLCPTRRTPSALLSSISILEGWGSCHSCLAGVQLTRASKPRTSAGLFSRL
ncbi:hypothetical protein CCHR01_02968 [Colletotrichum chrysophilum]|uniref:Uncharacterized protein n=1 Tax=Colletotrichum chrysophilum TaxID=1836956 RepID=A0AAD9ATP4_9PEZI|nr:hypothetical protein CCHR01_02968 [Colletotrichum chrysophilum]